MKSIRSPSSLHRPFFAIALLLWLRRRISLGPPPCMQAAAGPATARAPRRLLRPARCPCGKCVVGHLQAFARSLQAPPARFTSPLRVCGFRFSSFFSFGFFFFFFSLCVECGARTEVTRRKAMATGRAGARGGLRGGRQGELWPPAAAAPSFSFFFRLARKIQNPSHRTHNYWPCNLDHGGGGGGGRAVAAARRGRRLAAPCPPYPRAQPRVKSVF